MSIDILLIVLQNFLTILTTAVAYFELKKEFRKHTKIAKTEARKVLLLLVVICVITVFVQWLAFFNSNASQKTLENKLTEITKENASLRQKLSKVESKIVNKIDSTEAQIALNASINALNASKEIENSTKTLSSYLNGSNLPPRFALVNLSNPPLFVLENLDSVRAYIDAFVVNYDEVLKCSRINGRVDRKCYSSQLNPIQWVYILPNKQVYVELPKYDVKKMKSKFILHITLTKTQYKIQILILNTSNGILLNTRTLKKIKNNYSVVYIAGPNPNIDWDKEFVLPHDELFSNLE